MEKDDKKDRIEQLIKHLEEENRLFDILVENKKKDEEESENNDSEKSDKQNRMIEA